LALTANFSTAPTSWWACPGGDVVGDVLAGRGFADFDRRRDPGEQFEGQPEKVGYSERFVDPHRPVPRPQSGDQRARRVPPAMI
jgi:hypothetical protein